MFDFLQVCSAAVTFQLQQVSLMTSVLICKAVVVEVGAKESSNMFRKATKNIY